MPQKLTTERFIEKAKEVHGNKYNYSKVEYIFSQKKVTIICSIHGEFEQRPNDHLMGKGCYLCGKISSSNKNSSTLEEFISKAKEIHISKYDYSLVKYINTQTKVKIICPVHGIFHQTPHKHLSGNGCPKCSSSKGENRIRSYLIQNNILFEEQKRFKNCKNKLPLPFDFYLHRYNTLIEYDGELHFNKSRRKNSNEKFQKTIKHDKIKNNYCAENGINLIRVSYLVEDVEGFLDKGIERS
jgi:hypothetical protein